MPDTMTMPFEETPSPEMDEGVSLSEAEAKKLKQRLKTSERFKEQVFKPHYDTSLRLCRGIHWPEGKSSTNDESRVIVNMVYPIVSTKVSTLGFRHPEFNLTPVTIQSSERAQLATAAMRYEWKISKTQREAVRALHDKEVFKFGVVMTGWEFRTKGGVNRKDGREEVAGEQPEEAIDFEAMAREVSETGEPSSAVDPEEVICDQFYCKRISPWNFLIDPEGDWVLDNHEFCGYTEMVPVEQIKKDPRLKHNRDLKGSSRGMQSFLDDQYRDKDEKDHPTDIKRVKIFHYFEKKRRLYAMFCEEHDKPLLTEKWSWEHGRYPFRVLHAMGDEDCWYGTTPVELVQSQQEELNVTRTMLRNHIRRFARKYSVSRGMLDRVAKQQLKSAIDGAIVEHNGGPESKVINPIDHAQIPPEIYKTDEWAIRDMRFQTGLDEYDTNTVGKTRRTAQEVQQIRQAGGSRAQADAQAFEAFCAEIGEDCLDLLMQYSQKARSIPVYGPNENIIAWSDFTAEDIEGEYIVGVHIGSTQPKNSFEMQQTYAWLMQTLGPLAQIPDPQTGQPMINLKALVKGLLSNFPEIRNVDEILNTPPPPPPMMPGMMPGMGGPQIGPEGLPLPMQPQQMMGMPA
jgi:hypothetical protein